MTVETDSTFVSVFYIFLVHHRKGHERESQVQSIWDTEGTLYTDKQHVGVIIVLHHKPTLRLSY